MNQNNEKDKQGDEFMVNNSAVLFNNILSG